MHHFFQCRVQHLDQRTAGLVHDGPGVGGQGAAEEGGAEVDRHAGKPARPVNKIKKGLKI